MNDGCKHTPPKKPQGYEIESFVSGPLSGSGSCVITPRCDSYHVFEARNFHLYNVKAIVNASSMAKEMAVCQSSAETSEQNQWSMNGEVPAAPFRPGIRARRYGKRRFHTSLRSMAHEPDEDVIIVDYIISSPVQGTIIGTSFNVPVHLK